MVAEGFQPMAQAAFEVDAITLVEEGGAEAGYRRDNAALMLKASGASAPIRNWHALIVFREVVRHGGITRAAKALFISQPAVSQQVRTLEREIGATLLRRRGRSIEVTDAGEVVLAHTEAALHQLRAMETTLADLREGEGGHIHIVAGVASGPYLLAPLVGRYLREHPRVSIHMETLKADHLVESVLRDVADIGLTLKVSLPRGIVAREVFVDELVAVAAHDHPLARQQRPHEPSDLEDQTLFLPSAGAKWDRVVVDTLTELGINPQREVILPNAESMKRAMAAAAGISLMLRSSVAQEVAAGTLTVIEVRGLPRRVPLVLIHRRDKKFSLALSRFAAFLEEHLQMMEEGPDGQAEPTGTGTLAVKL